MDSYREHPSDFEPECEDAGVAETAVAAIGTDERRMHVRAYNYWVSLLDGRDFPSIEDLEPGDLADFAANSVLLDFTGGRDNPATPYIGAAIRDECDLHDEVQTISAVPSRSLLSRLTDHYMQIIANRAPVGFEAEFDNQRGDTICYRGILMPFSSDGDTIDFIYGVINWKKTGQAMAEQATTAPEAHIAPEMVGETGPEVPFSPPEADEDLFETQVELDETAGLADRLWAARESAEVARNAEARSRDALYRALGRAYDFALAALAAPDDYSELLEESGVKAQARAPMTPIVRLVFGIDYDKARLTEYAAALAHAQRLGVESGGFLALIEGQAGGLKALVAAERKARRPEPRADTKTAKALDRLRSAPAVQLGDISIDEEFALVLTRRSSAGGHEAVAVIEDQALVERAMRRAAG